MAIAPSNNLLAALSQLQGNRPAAPARPAAVPQGNAGNVGATPSSFAAQLAAPQLAVPAAAIRTTPAERPTFAASATPVNQPPIPARGGYLGRHVNIVV